MGYSKTIWDWTAMGKFTDSSWINGGRYAARAVMLTLFCVTLPACGVSQLTEPFQRGLFGSGGEEGPQANESGQLAAAAQSGPAAQRRVSKGCPSFDIADGNRSITFHAPGLGNDHLAVMHRGEIQETARECRTSPTGISVKYGFSGRVLLGPKGKPGSITLPAKLIVNSAQGPVKTENVRVVVNVPGGATTGSFSEVRQIELPLPQNGSAKSYKITIGFDQAKPGAS